MRMFQKYAKKRASRKNLSLHASRVSSLGFGVWDFFEFWDLEFGIFSATFLLLLATAAPAFATAPNLSSITPSIGQLGKEMEVSFEGERLEDTVEIIPYEPGLKILKLNSVTNKAVKAQIRIEPDCQLGEHHLRLRTESGISELRTFFVGPFAVINETEPNNELDK